MHLSDEYLAQALMDKMRGGNYRLQATFAHPLLLVQYIAFALPLTAYVAIESRSSFYRTISWIAVPYLIATSLFTGSRSALVAIVVVLMMLALLYIYRTIHKRQLLLLATVVSFGLVISTLALFAVVTLTHFDMSYFTGRSLTEIQSSGARLKMLQNGIPLVLNHPALGYGIGTAATVLGFTGEQNALTIDNFFLSLALESGFVGLLIYFVFAGVAILKGSRAGVNTESEIALLANMAAISIVGMLAVQTILSLSYILPLFFLSAALASRVCVLHMDSAA
jgi:O-antigen ligase